MMAIIGMSFLSEWRLLQGVPGAFLIGVCTPEDLY